MSTKRSKEKETNKNRSSSSEEYTGKGRYLPDGTLNIAGRWKSTLSLSLFSFLKVNRIDLIKNSFKNKGPGPGKYLLPPCTGFINHDFTLTKKPAYTIGNKWSDLSKLFYSDNKYYF